MEESSAEEMPDIIPPVEVEMQIGDEIILPPEDDNSAAFNDYKKEMLESGLESADLEYLCTAYKKLEDVKFIKIHCSSCDKHIGSAPNDLQNRYEHPLLKVLICGDCFQFYSSGDFEKDEDGSELYCRWCGEGGQVFCCTKCPYVFCKKCIRRNLGRQAAKLIENSDNWMCFSCDPSQICRHRATYWAIQKYSEEMIQTSKMTGDTSILSVDDNICCTTSKRRSDIYSKLLQPPKKKQRMATIPTLQQIPPLQTKNKKTNKTKTKGWQPPTFSQQPEDEVICTPDILPLDISPPHSPERSTPPPMIPLMQQGMPPMPVPMAGGTPKVPPLIIRPPVQRSLNISDLQKHLRQNYTQLVLTPRPKLRERPPMNPAQAVLLRKNSPLPQKNTPQNNGNYKFVLNSTPTSSNMINSNFVIGPMNKMKLPVSNIQTPVSNQQNTITNQQNTIPNKIPTLKVNTTNNSNQDWFDKALLDCAEITEYISTKISSLSGVHTRAYKSEKLMTELHNTFQTYMQVASEKINKIRRVMQQNYENDMEKHFVQNKKMVNPFAKKKRKRSLKVSDISSSEESNSKDSDYVDSNSRDTNSRNCNSINNSNSADDNSKDYYESNSRDSLKSINKTKFILTKNIQPEEVLFDMDVTNASDEEQKNDNESDDDVQEIIDTRRNEVIEIDDSDDEERKNEEHKDKVHQDEEQKDEEHKNEKLENQEHKNAVKEELENEDEKNEECKDIEQKNEERKDEEQKDEEHKDEEQKNEELTDKSQADDKENDLFTVPAEVLERIKSKHNIHNMSTKELLKYLTAVVIATPKTNPETEELSDLKKMLQMVEVQRNIEIKLKTNIQKLTEESALTNTSNNVESDPILSEKQNLASEKDHTSNDSEKYSISEIEKEIIELAAEENAKNVSNNSEESDKESNSAEKANNEDNNSDENNDEPYDIEDILGSNVLVKPNKTASASFGDAFSKFVCTNVQEPEVNEPDIPDPEDDDISDINIARELEIIPDYVNDICNRDNGSLSLPPDSITSICTNDMEMLMNKDLKEKDSDLVNNKSDSEVMLNSEILALQQLAENCVNNIDDHKSSTECKG